MPDLDVVLFDLDGTLTDPSGDFVVAMRAALESVGATVPPDDDLRTRIGPPLLHTLAAFGLDDDTAAVVMARYRTQYRANRSADTTVHSGIPELLDALRGRGVRIGVATSKPAVIATEVLEQTGLAPLVDAIAGPGLDERDAAKHLVIAAALDQHGRPAPERVRMVGDRSFDVVGARTHGIDAIGVLWGFGDAEELTGSGAAAVADTVPTLRNLLVDEPSDAPRSGGR